MKIKIITPKTSKEWKQYYNLRHEVMNKPSGYPKSSAYDEKDAKSIHVAAFYADKIVGVGRLHYDNDDFGTGYIRFMAVAFDNQSQGIGSKILEEIEARAKKQGSKELRLKARENAVGFYKKNGFKILDKCTEKFFKTPHWNMKKTIK